MRAVTARWVAYVIGAGSIALIIGSVVLAYLDRHASLPAGQQTWGFSYAFGEAVNIAVPAVGLVLASRRPANPSDGCSWRRAPRSAWVPSGAPMGCAP